MSNCTFSNNTGTDTQGDGAAIRAKKVLLTMSGCTLEGNSNTGKTTGSSKNAYDGGLSVQSGTVTLADSVTFTGNNALQTGGGSTFGQQYYIKKGTTFNGAVLTEDKKVD